jgi:hypothetical protein
VAEGERDQRLQRAANGDAGAIGDEARHRLAHAHQLRVIRLFAHACLMSFAVSLVSRYQ